MQYLALGVFIIFLIIIVSIIAYFIIKKNKEVPDEESYLRDIQEEDDNL